MSLLMLPVNEPDRQIKNYARNRLKICRQVNGEKNGKSERLYHNKGAAIKIEWIERWIKTWSRIWSELWAWLPTEKKDRQFWTDCISITNVEALPTPSPRRSVGMIHEHSCHCHCYAFCILRVSFFVVFWLCKNKKCTHHTPNTKDKRITGTTKVSFIKAKWFGSFFRFNRG